MGKIVFISSLYTGYGHRSITEAVREQLSLLDSGVELAEIDGFELGGSMSAAMSRLYDWIVTHTPVFWKIYYQLGNVFPAIANFYTITSISKAFCSMIRETKPDLIAVVHPCFVGPVEALLARMDSRIPVIPLIADLDNVSRLWADKRSAFTLCPTENARKTMLHYGVPYDRTKVFGFPVRERFSTADTADINVLQKKERLNFLIMNGSQGHGRVLKMAAILLEHFDCNVVVLAGNNPKWKVSVESKLRRFGNRITVCGFVTDVERYMRAADILLLRASPNVMMEAVNLCRPFIITGALSGQEEKNPAYARANHFGVVCKRVSELPAIVRGLLDKDAEQLRQIEAHQREFRKPQAARDTAAFFLSLLQESAKKGGIP